MIVAADNRRSAIALLAGFLCALSLVGAGQASAAPLPAPTLTPQQPNPTKLASPSFTIQGDPAATFACKLDDEESYTTCTSPLTIGPLAEGQHTLRVLQIDSTGEPSDEAAVYSFEVDLTAPDAPGASLFIPDSAEYSVADSGFITGETSARAEFSSHDPDDVTFQCSLDGADPEDCDSPYTTGLDSLADGTHTLLITQTDEAGNVSDPATLSWTIDTEAPGDVTFDDPYASWTSATTFLADDSANISWTLPSDTGTTIRAVCSLDGGPGEDCDDSLSTSFSSLRDGPHSLKVTVVDAAGNTSPGVTISWTTDTVEPESPTVKVNRPAYTPETTATVEFSGEPHATFSCSVNGDPAVPCTSPLPLSSLDDGEQSVTVIQTDRAGNESDPATVTWTVDTVAPDAAADLDRHRARPLGLLPPLQERELGGLEPVQLAEGRQGPAARRDAVRAQVPRPRGQRVRRRTGLVDDRPPRSRGAARDRLRLRDRRSARLLDLGHRPRVHRLGRRHLRLHRLAALLEHRRHLLRVDHGH